MTISIVCVGFPVVWCYPRTYEHFFSVFLFIYFFLSDENSTSTYRYKKQGQKLRKLRGYYTMWPLGKELDNQKQVDWL